MEQIEFLEENEIKLNMKIRKLRSAEVPDDLEKERLEQLEQEKADLTQVIKTLERKKRELEKETPKTSGDEGNSVSDEEIEQLREKVDILLDTEESLLDRLSEKEAIEKELRAEVKRQKDEEELLQGHLQGAENHILELERHLEELEKDMVKNLESDPDKRHQEAQKEICTLRKRLEEQMASEKVLKIRISDLEKSEAALKNELAAAVSAKQKLEMIEKELRQALEDATREHQALRSRCSQLEEQLRRVQSGNVNGVMTNGHHTAQETQLKASSSHPVLATPPKPLSSQPSEQRINGHHESQLTDIGTLEKLSQEEYISRIQELERMEAFHRSKMEALDKNLESLRQAVETVSVSMETDAGIPVGSRKANLKVKIN